MSTKQCKIYYPLISGLHFSEITLEYIMKNDDMTPTIIQGKLTMREKIGSKNSGVRFCSLVFQVQNFVVFRTNANS